MCCFHILFNLEIFKKIQNNWILFSLLKRPNNSTPKVANIKKSKTNKKPKFLISGNALTTVSIRERKPFAVLRILSILATRRTLITLMMVGFIGIVLLSLNFSNRIPIIDKIQIIKSNWFHLYKLYKNDKIRIKEFSFIYFSLMYLTKPSAIILIIASIKNIVVNI